MKLTDLSLGILYFLIGHILVFYQLNGQFIWKSFKENEVLVASGIIISFFFIWGTKYTVDSQWTDYYGPARFIGFSIGMIQYGSL